MLHGEETAPTQKSEPVTIAKALPASSVKPHPTRDPAGPVSAPPDGFRVSVTGSAFAETVKKARTAIAINNLLQVFMFLLLDSK